MVGRLAGMDEQEQTTKTGTEQRAPADWREYRRMRAWELAQAGWTQQAIAEALGVTHGAVSQWLKRAGEGGLEALRTKKAAGPRPKLTDEQRRQLV